MVRRPLYLQPARDGRDRWLISYTDILTLLLILFVAIWFFVIRDTWNLAVTRKSLAGIACLAFLPTIFFGLMIENMLANSGAPGGMGFVLVLSLSAATAGEYYARSNGTISAPAPTPRHRFRAPATNPRPVEG